jgi:hypothetical protein
VKPPIPTERQVQRAILAMCGIAFPDVLVVHIPNGAHLSGDERSRCMQMGALKGDGLKIGFPDLGFYWNHGHCLMEVKRPGGKLSPQQVIMHVRLRARLYPGRRHFPRRSLRFPEGEGRP